MPGTVPSVYIFIFYDSFLTNSYVFFIDEETVTQTYKSLCNAIEQSL